MFGNTILASYYVNYLALSFPLSFGEFEQWISWTGSKLGVAMSRETETADFYIRKNRKSEGTIISQPDPAARVP